MILSTYVQIPVSQQMCNITPFIIGFFFSSFFIFLLACCKAKLSTRGCIRSHRKAPPKYLPFSFIFHFEQMNECCYNLCIYVKLSEQTLLYRLYPLVWQSQSEFLLALYFMEFQTKANKVHLQQALIPVLEKKS